MPDIRIPSNPQAEMSFLGSVLMDTDILLEATVTPADFWTEKHADIFTAMLRLFERERKIDYVTLCSALQSDGKLESVGGGSYIAGLASYVPSPLNWREYQTLIQNTAAQRQIVSAAGEIAGIAYNAETEREEMLTQVQGVVNRIDERMTRAGELVPWSDAVGEHIIQIEGYLEKEKERAAIPTGLKVIDSVTGGLPRGEVTLIAADPGMGKTHLAINIAENAARRGYHGIIFSLEMTRRQLMDRFFAKCGNLKVKDLRAGRFNAVEKDRMYNEVDNALRLPILISDTPQSTETIRRAVMRAQRRGVVDYAVVDYSLLLMDKGESEIVRNMTMSRNLKNIAKATGVTVVVVHPINRNGDETKPPTIRNLGWGRCWEYDAYLVLFPYFKRDRTTFDASITIGKFRDGEPGGEQPAFFNGKQWADIETKGAGQW